MNTVVINTKELKNPQPALRQAAEILRQGGLVIFPTETVYGIAVRANLPHALDRLSKLKERPDNKPFTLHIGDKKRLSYFVGPVHPLDQALIRRAWPGPLTCVFELPPQTIDTFKRNFDTETFTNLYYNNTIGIRLPDHPIAQKLLNLVPSPIVAPSANWAGQKPPNSAQEAIDQLNGHVDLVLNAGPTRYAKPSTVIKLSNNSMEILRPGVFDIDTLKRMRKVTFLFVCTGNTCRSPMAEGFAKKILTQTLRCDPDQLERLGYQVISAGIAAAQGCPASDQAVAVCQDLGVDISDHRSRALSGELLRQADFIFAMTDSHKKNILQIDKHLTVETLDPQKNIEDPIGQSLSVYQHCAAQIACALQARLADFF